MYLKNILVTRFWHPTNEKLRRFSNNLEKNPEGWIGENWNGMGFDVYAYFPETDPRLIEKWDAGTGYGELTNCKI